MVFVESMIEEVNELCGKSYSPKSDAGYRRGGSAPGYIVVNGKVEKIERPRVRKKTAQGKEVEAELITYRAAQDFTEIENAILQAMAAGISTRGVARVFPEAAGTSPSSVSKRWVRIGRKFIDEFRSRDLAKESPAGWFGLMIDGVGLADDLMAIVALGLAVDGRKVVLDFEIGSSENFETCSALLTRLKDRGLRFGGAPLAVLDGSQALAKAVRQHYPDAKIQRCLVHKERNIRACLSKKHHGELARLFSLLRNAEGEDAGREKLADLRRFLARHSHKATESLDEAGDELITLHILHAPSTLNVSLLSTNNIENIFKSTRLKINRVTRWRSNTNQASRWLAYAFLEAEKGFRHIKGYKDIPLLLERLGWSKDAVSKAKDCVP
jgi:transposase-like protein